MSGDGLFFSKDSEILIKEVSLTACDIENDVQSHFDISFCKDWLQSNSQLKRIALQFPDELLAYSTSVVLHLSQAHPGAEYFVLADTSYGSCCVDAVAAKHYSADGLIHFGRSCLSSSDGIPVLIVLGRNLIKTEECVGKLTEILKNDVSYLLMCDTTYHHAADEIAEGLRSKGFYIQLTHLNTACAHAHSDTSHTQVSDSLVSQAKNTLALDKHTQICGRCYMMDRDDYKVIYIGDPESRSLVNLMICMNAHEFISYNPTNKEARKESRNINKLLMKRYYMVERCKEALIVGIVVGTLSVTGYKLIHQRLRTMCTKAGKKVYTLLVGKLNPAKLANFMEVDIFVLVSCPENSLLDSSEFYKPIVTPYEMELACNRNREWTGSYITDYQTLLPGGDNHQHIDDMADSEETDVSLISGKMLRVGGMNEEIETSNQLVMRDENELTLSTNIRSAGEYFANRSWRGLEKDLGQTPVEKSKAGRSGIASTYQNEPPT